MAIAAIDEENIIILGGSRGRVQTYQNVHVFNARKETIVLKKNAKLVESVRDPLVQVYRGVFLLQTHDHYAQVEYELETGISKLICIDSPKFESQ